MSDSDIKKYVDDIRIAVININDAFEGRERVAALTNAGAFRAKVLGILQDRLDAEYDTKFTSQPRLTTVICLKQIIEEISDLGVE